MEWHQRPDNALQIAVNTWGAGGALITVVGEVDYLTAPRLKTQLWWVLAEFDPNELVVDLAGVSFLDSTGRGALLHGWRQAQRQNCQLTVVNPQPRVLSMLRIAGVTTHLGLGTAAPGGKELGRQG